jgi:hypothetical protein
MIEHIYHTIGSPQIMEYGKFYKEQVERIPDGGRFVEVGVYHGQSFSFFIVEMLNAGKKFDCVAVDACPWYPEPCAGFDRHMEPLKDHFRTMFERVDSFVAARNFEDGSIDTCFIDANHTGDFPKKDIAAYLPKMKKGGVMAGHDFDAPDVERAVREAFGDKFTHDPKQNIWYVEIS